MNRLNTFLLALLLTLPVMAQNSVTQHFNTEQYGAILLGIAPEARGGGMGDLGVATEADANSQYWNTAKMPFNIARAGVSLSYTPWLRKIVGGINLLNLSGFYRIGEYGAVSSSVRFFSVGQVDLYDQTGMTLNPYEMAIDVGYSRMLSETFSMGVALRFILSDMGNSTSSTYHSAKAFAADICMYRSGYFMIGNREVNMAWGLSLLNIGSKLNYGESDHSQFLPATLRLGINLTVPINDYNRISFGVETMKYMIPTPPCYTKDDPETQGENPTARPGDPLPENDPRAEERYYNVSPIAGIFKSFADAPGGFSEELKEFRWSFGAEYTYNDRFSLRAGYHYENPDKGNRTYFTVGAGFRMSVFTLDASYVFSTAAMNPLDQTMRFTLGCDLDGIKDLFGRKR